MQKLPKAPLQEVIFELRWNLGFDSTIGQHLDPGFEMAQGRFQGLVEQEFPFNQRLLPSGIPLVLQNHTIVHQFWKAEETYPVLQLGPGIFAQNDTEKNYEWEGSFLPQLKRSLNWLAEAYRQPIEPAFVNLRYIDAIQLRDYSTENNWLDFIAEALKIRLENLFEPSGKLRNFQINQSFGLENDSELNIVVSNGITSSSKEPALVWQTAVTKTGNIEWGNLLSLAEEAHSETHKIFESMTKGMLYDSFK
jgi:uncharacterized protein (TIGR04255 family)